MLCRLRFQLLRRRDKRHQRHVDKQGVLASQLLPHLPDRFHERQRLDIADRAAHLHDRDIDLLRDLLHRGFDLVGHMGNHLHRLPEIVSAPLLCDDLLVQPPCRPVVVARKFGVREALVVPRSRSVSAPSSVTKTSPCWKGDMVPGSTFRYGSNFIMFTRRPRLSSKQPMEAAAKPLPKLDTTPPVTKTYFADIAATSSPGCWDWEYLVGTIKYDRTGV